MIHPSTFSIVAFSADETAWGIAVASKFPAVGAVVPWARAGAGAVATQSLANTAYGPVGLDLMAGGLTAQQALDRFVESDGDRALRQVGLVDANGGAATFTGDQCLDWAGGQTGPGYAAQGNILTGHYVVQAMAEAPLFGEMLSHVIVTVGDVAFGVGLGWMGYSLWSEKRQPAQ